MVKPTGWENRQPKKVITADEARRYAKVKSANDSAQHRSALINELNQRVYDAAAKGESSLALPASMLSEDGFVTQLQAAGFQVTCDANDKTKVTIYW